MSNRLEFSSTSLVKFDMFIESRVDEILELSFLYKYKSISICWGGGGFIFKRLFHCHIFKNLVFNG